MYYRYMDNVLIQGDVIDPRPRQPTIKNLLSFCVLGSQAHTNLWSWQAWVSVQRILSRRSLRQEGEKQTNMKGMVREALHRVAAAGSWSARWARHAGLVLCSSSPVALSLLSSVCG